MTTVTQGYMSPDIHDKSRTFFSGLDKVEKNNNIPRGYGKSANAVSQRAKEMLRQADMPQQLHGDYPSVLNGDDLASFFDLEPQTNPGSPYQNNRLPTSVAPDMNGMWNNMGYQTVSPPESAVFAPADWAHFEYQNQSLPNILTDIYPNDTRVQYGQTTPPDDDNSSMLDYQHKQQRQQQPLQSALASPVTGAKKRKRVSTSTNGSSTSPSKRTRKNAARSNLTNPSVISPPDPNNPEDVRRSKFLERNRVAASKCRQKKKEWTTNLETRARDLQKNNSSLRMMLGSLKDEILFLKGEMLKHTACGCEQIQAFLKQGGDDFTEAQEDMFKKEQSPIGTAPTSRQGSFATGSDDGSNEFEDAASSNARHSSPSVLPEEHGLEALLSSQLVHDTSEDGIAHQVQVAT